MGQRDADSFDSLVELYLDRRDTRPEAPLHDFLDDAGETVTSYTRAQMVDRAQAVAVGLREHAPAGARVLVVHAAGADFVTAFHGCLFAGMVPVPLPSPEPRRWSADVAHLLGVAADCRAALVLGPSEATAPLDAALDAALGAAGASAGRRPRVLATDELVTADPAQWVAPPVDGERTAHLQYSSGSTGRPRGVVLAHRSVLAQIGYLDRALELTEDVVVASWLPMFHDMGLVTNVLAPFGKGTRSVLMTPTTFIKRPVRWVEAISRHRATLAVAPNFAYDLVVRRTTPEQRAALDLSSWDLAMCGAEPIRPDTMDRFAEAFAPAGLRREALYPCYGLAETTLMAAGGPRRAAPVMRDIDPAGLDEGELRPAADGTRARRVVSSGVVDEAEAPVAIVDPQTLTPLPDGRIGEILVAGGTVGRGYFGAPEVSRATFGVRVEGRGENDFVRTGDLGTITDGMLYVTGRQKDLVIVDGRNHYPHDIENSVESQHPGIRSDRCVAFSVEDGDRERLVLVSEVEQSAVGDDPAGLVDAIRGTVSTEHGVEVHDVVLLRSSRVPLTTSGKRRRLACRDLYLAGALS